jgi:hypothetical protein
MKTPDQFRLRTGSFGTSKEEHGNNGFFYVKFKGIEYKVLASDGGGWEHVSVSGKFIAPDWETMCHMKSLFWDDDEVVMQLHPAKKDWVNMHENCLHLWKPIGITIPTPPKEFV